MARPETRLIAVDLDGTLLRDDKSISPRVAASVARCAERGIAVVLASARPPRAVRGFYHQLGLQTPQLNYNGALLWDEPAQRVLDHRPISAACSVELIAQARTLFPNVLVSCEILDRWHTDRIDANFLTATARLLPPDVIAPLSEIAHLDVTKLMFQGPPAMMDGLATALDDRRTKPVRTDPDLLQFMSVEAGKGVGLRRLSGGMHIPMNCVMAIGDNDNDIEMLEAAGFAVAMGHADKRVKAVADHVAPSNQEDGVAVAIERFVFGAD